MTERAKNARKTIVRQRCVPDCYFFALPPAPRPRPAITPPFCAPPQHTFFPPSFRPSLILPPPPRKVLDREGNIPDGTVPKAVRPQVWGFSHHRRQAPARPFQPHHVSLFLWYFVLWGVTMVVATSSSTLQKKIGLGGRGAQNMLVGADGGN